MGLCNSPLSLVGPVELESTVSLRSVSFGIVARLRCRLPHSFPQPACASLHRPLGALGFGPSTIVTVADSFSAVFTKEKGPCNKGLFFGGTSRTRIYDLHDVNVAL